MKPLLLLILDLPASVQPGVGLLEARGHWREPSALADAALASLLTGVPVAAHGVLSEWELRPDGQNLRAAPRHRLMAAPWWERIEGAIAVGVPWSTGSRAGGGVVSADFVRIDVPGSKLALPDRVWPETLNADLAPLRLEPEELDAATLAELGYSSGGVIAQRELAAWLSLHTLGTALLDRGPPPLVIIRLNLALEPEEPLAAARFVEAVIERYRILWQPSELMLLVRRVAADDVGCEVFGSEPGMGFDSALGMGAAMAARFGLAVKAQPLEPPYWETLRARYCPPDHTLPGTAASIRSVTARVDEALLHLAGAVDAGR